MRSLTVPLLASLLCLIGACDRNGTKSVHDLNGEERGALQELIQVAYSNVTRDNSCFVYTTTYRVMPKPDGSYGEELDIPLELPSYVCLDRNVHDEEFLSALHAEIARTEFFWRSPAGPKKRLVITHGFVRDQDRMGRGPMVTVIPLRVSLTAQD